MPFRDHMQHLTDSVSAAVGVFGEIFATLPSVSLRLLNSICPQPNDGIVPKSNTAVSCLIRKPSYCTRCSQPVLQSTSLVETVPLIVSNVARRIISPD